MVIIGMNSFGPQVYADMRFYWLCMEHQEAVITLTASLTSLNSAEVPRLLWKDSCMKFSYTVSKAKLQGV